MMSRNKWQLHRAGIFNFWYYDDEELEFADGKLLLRGSNGSGKSVTMQSFIPLLLDGRKREEAALREHDVFKAEAEKVQVERTITTLQENIRAKEKGLEQKRQTEMRLRRQIDMEEDKAANTETVMKSLLEHLAAEAGPALFAGHHPAAAEFRKGYTEEFAFDLWRQETAEYLTRLENILKVLKEQTRARDKYEDADRDRAEAQRILDGAEHEASKANSFFDEEKDRYLGAFHAWVKHNRELLLSADEIRRTSSGRYRCSSLTAWRR